MQGPPFKTITVFHLALQKVLNLKLDQVMYLKNFGFYQDNISYLHFLNFYTCKNGFNVSVFIKQLY